MDGTIEPYRMIFDSLDEAVALCQIITDGVGRACDYRMLEVNPAFEAITGITLAAARTKTMRELVPDLPEAWVDMASRVALEGETLRLKQPSLDGNGWYSLFATPAGGEGCFVIRFHDITRYIQADERLRQSEAEFRTMFELSNVGIVQIDVRSGGFFRVNECYCTIVGYSREELLGRSFAELTHPDDRAQDIQTFYAMVRGDIQEYNVEKRYIRKDNRVIWVTVMARLLRDETGQPLRTVAAILDITERKQAEAALRESEVRFRTLADAIPQIVWANDAEGKATYFNQRWFDYSGLSFEQSREYGAQAAVHPEDGPALMEGWLKALAAGQVFEAEYRLRRYDGVYRWYLGRNMPVRNEAGQITGWFGSATDIEDLKQAEAARRESALLRRLTMAQEEERLRIARDLHDQLGQYTTGLLLGLKNLEGRAHGSPLAELIAPLQGIALEMAKETHRLALNLRSTALEDVGLIPSLEQLANQWSSQSDIPVAFLSSSVDQRRLPRRVEIELYRIVQEALTNIQKHAGATHVGLIVEARSDQVVLMIEDNGQGFESDALAADGERPGLGLPGMGERVAQVGGMLVVESSPGMGTTVLVRVPRSES
ncbi:MAG: PAS domain S-box protein [Chloroflexaceae bacterium]|jgi:PAS domain S-box-containing protein|nr:PAS domain S-box protein [Chloroflexaceae bacterium]